MLPLHPHQHPADEVDSGVEDRGVFDGADVVDWREVGVNVCQERAGDKCKGENNRRQRVEKHHRHRGAEDKWPNPVGGHSQDGMEHNVDERAFDDGFDERIEQNAGYEEGIQIGILQMRVVGRCGEWLEQETERQDDCPTKQVQHKRELPAGKAIDSGQQRA